LKQANSTILELQEKLQANAAKEKQLLEEKEQSNEKGNEEKDKVRERKKEKKENRVCLPLSFSSCKNRF
jgi:hypothetical protein